MFLLLVSTIYGLSDTGAPATGYRPLNGTGNNIAYPEYGAYLTFYSRYHSSPGFSDGISALPLNRPEAKMVSNTLFGAEPSVQNSDAICDLLAYWGQFVAHDVALTKGNSSDNMPVNVNTCDFVDFGVECGGIVQYNISRALKALRPQGDYTPINFQTSFIDASTVYGPNQAQNNLVRAFSNGLLETWFDPVSGAELLPVVNVNSSEFSVMDSARVTPNTKIFLAGDVRANVHPALQTLHTLFVREHNRRARELYQNNTSMSDEEIYQRARAWVIALVQKITYTQYYPTLIGSSLPTYTGYKEQVDATISADFIGMAYRYGHSAISSEILRLDENGLEDMKGHLLLRDHFFNTAGILTTNGDIESILRGLVSQRDQEADSLMVDDLRKHFTDKPYDLATINVMRGRDFGLPSYNALREANGLAPAMTWSDITSNTAVQQRLASVYSSVWDVDPWVGGLCEDKDPSSGSHVGPLFTTVIANQFTALRDGDRFWYERDGVLTPQEQQQLQSWTLSTVILKNTNISYFPSNAFALYNGPFTQASTVSSSGSQSYVATSDYTIKWSLVGTTAISFTLCGNFQGWMGIGLNPNAVSMLGSDFMIAIPDQTTGVFTVKTYHGYVDQSVPSLSSVYSIDPSTVVDAKSTCGTTQGVTFQRPLAPGGTAQLLSSNSSVYLIFAYGVNYYSLSAPHGPANRGGTQVNFFATSASITSDPSLVDTLLSLELNLVAMHGVVLFTCFAVVFPTGIFIIRYMKLNKNSLAIHKTLMSMGVYTSEITMLALSLGVRSKFGYTHVKFGIAMFCVLTTTAFLGNQSTRLKTIRNINRRHLKLAHRIMGACAMCLGYITAAFGVLDISAYNSSFEGMLIYIYLACIAFVVAVFFFVGESGIFNRIWAEKAAAQQSQPRGYYWSEIIQRIENGENWIIIGSCVYDVTEFRFKHPGGMELLDEAVGTDATRSFFGTVAPLPKALNVVAESSDTVQKSATVTPLVKSRPRAKSSSFKAPKEKVPKFLIPAHSSFAIQQLHSMFVGRILDYIPTYEKQLLKRLPNELSITSSTHGKKAMTNSAFSVASSSVSMEDRYFFISKYLSEMEIKTADANPGIFPSHYINLRVMAKFLVTGPNAKCPVYKFRLHFETPELQINFLPGDHIIVMHRILNEKSNEEKLLQCISRKYTPIKVSNQGYMELVIKIYKDGALTPHLGQLSVGDKVRVRGYFEGQKVLGPAVPSYPPYETVLLLCAGSGITPMLLLIDYFIKASVSVKPPKILLLTQNSTVDDIIMESEINDIMSRNMDILHVVNYLSNPPPNWRGGVKGRITPEDIEKLNLFTENVQNYGIFISGPPGFQDGLKKYFVSRKNMDPERVFVL
ncbi:hypothetical protein HK103_006026 [Boothiomyces macroporosus]|uniref:Uncharacterized protein n=1 Tax=Boothiomyces macroporosus TaxID=261099 RepID=A0AAD5Y6I4_9FUNG|nr:hypothetical protein HK103_006026 [Boothiomyces macroporosus]